MPDVRMRLLTSDTRTEDGKSWAALEIEMPETTKTYWRVPGETGVPTVLDFSRSRGVADASVAWPFPTRDIGSDYLDYAYYGHLVLPVAMSPTGEEMEIVVDATLGICAEVCIPVQATFSLQSRLDQPDRISAFRIEQAKALVPSPEEGAGVFGEALLDRETGSVRVALETPLNPEDVIAEIEGTMALFDAPHLSPDGQWLHFELLSRRESEQLEDANLLLSYQSSDGASVVSRPLEPE